MVQHVTAAILMATTATVTSALPRAALAPPPLAPIAERYARASAFYDGGYDRLMANTDLHPMFSRDGRSVLYRLGASGSSELMVYDLVQGRSHAIVTEARLADMLSRAVGRQVSAYGVGLDGADYADGIYRFDFGGRRWSLSADGRLDGTPDAPSEPNAARSPDGRFEIVARGYDLVARDRRSGREVALTRGGTREQPYGRGLALLADMIRTGSEEPPMPVSVRWSPDSRSIVTWRLDTRGVIPLTMTQQNPGTPYPRSFHYIYPLAGAAKVPRFSLLAVNVEQALARRRAQLVPLAVPDGELLYPGDPYVGWIDRTIRVQRTERGYGKIEIFSVDPATGVATTVAREAVKPLVTVTATELRPEPALGGELVTSERSGWAQLYLVRPDDPDGGFPLTRGDWEVTALNRVDAAAGTILLTGMGREHDRDPYCRALYRVTLNGAPPVLLTPEPIDHDTEVSADGRWFVDAMSSPTKPTVTVVRSTVDGRIVAELGRADAAGLLAQGYAMPEPFRGLAADGKTPLYGMIWRPAHFDPGRRYPVIDYVYTGPTTHAVPVTWRDAVRAPPASVAQLGAVAVTIDGRGTSGRGQAFRLPAYQNLGEVGIDDHIAMIRQMAVRYPSIDPDRAGVFGFSAGGYDAARFILRRPGFFKVAVAGAGNHDLRLDKAWWPEVSMGLAAPEVWERNSNMSVAGNLRGKLLLIHGDVDDNVPVTETYRLAAALIAKGRDVDVAILPNTSHRLYQPFFFLKMWDYFVRHLLNEAPPARS